MRQLKVLELFSGTRSIGKAFERRGHEVYSVDWDESFDADWYVDLETVTADQVVKRFGHPDVIWASPDCGSFSVAAIGKNRDKDPNTGTLRPKSEHSLKSDRVDLQVIRLIRDLNPPPVVHREPAWRHEEDGLDAVGAEAHGHLLPVHDQAASRATQDEADRPLVEPPEPEVRATVQERRSVPRRGPQRVNDGDAGHEGG